MTEQEINAGVAALAGRPSDTVYTRDVSAALSLVEAVLHPENDFQLCRNQDEAFSPAFWKARATSADGTPCETYDDSAAMAVCLAVLGAARPR